MAWTARVASERDDFLGAMEILSERCAIREPIFKLRRADDRING